MVVTNVSQNPRAVLAGLGACCDGGACRCVPHKARRASLRGDGLGLLDSQIGTAGLAAFSSPLDAFGYVLGNPQLGQQASEPNAVLVRATNLANVVVLGMQSVPVGQRKHALQQTTGNDGFVTSVMSLASRAGGLGAEDAVRFALAMHFTVGILAHDAGRSTREALVYKHLTDKYRAAGTSTVAGLGSLGNAQSCAPWDLICHGRNAVDNAGRAANDAGRAAAQAVEQAFNWTGDVLCNGFKAIFGPQLGGILCTLFSYVVSFAKNTAQATIMLVRSLVNALIEFLKKLMRGDIPGALKVLMVELMGTLFVAPPLGPFLATFMGISLTELQNMGKRVAQKSPMFIVQVAAAIMGVLPPTPSSIVALISALRPAIVVLAGEAISRTTRFARAKAEQAVDMVISIGCSITLGVANIASIVDDLRRQMNEAGGVSGFIGGNIAKLSPKYRAAWERCKTDPGKCDFTKLIEQDLKSITDAFARFKLQEIIRSIGDLVTLFTLGPPDAGKPLPPPPKPIVPKAFEELTPGEKAEKLKQFVSSVDFNRIGHVQRAAVTSNINAAVDSLAGKLTDDGRAALMLVLLRRVPAQYHKGILVTAGAKL